MCSAKKPAGVGFLFANLWKSLVLFPLQSSVSILRVCALLIMTWAKSSSFSRFLPACIHSCTCCNGGNSLEIMAVHAVINLLPEWMISTCSFWAKIILYSGYEQGLMI